MDTEFREMMFSRMPRELDILRSAAANFSRDANNALIMCRLYFPGLPTAKARCFLQWLSVQRVY